MLQIFFLEFNGSPLKPNQKLKITAYSYCLPLVYKIVETAYKDFNSGLVSVELLEDELEKLKIKYGIREDFEYKLKRDEELQEGGAAFVRFDDTLMPYDEAGLTTDEIESLIDGITTLIPLEVQSELDINPEEILNECLSLREGQPLSICGSREHLPQILKLAEAAYKKGTKLVHGSLKLNN